MLSHKTISTVGKLAEHWCGRKGTAVWIIRSAHRAAVFRDPGKPIALEAVKKVEKLKSDEVRVKVHYCSLNSTDVKILSGKHKELNIPLPFIPGHEFSGEIVEIGKENPHFFNCGDRVVVMNDLQDPNGGLISEAIVKNRDVWTVPQSVPLKEMAVLPYGHGTALLTFALHCHLKENDLIIITAGPAGMGLAAIDLAVSVYKAKVIAICDTESSSDLVRAKGAHISISIRKNNFKKLYKDVQAAMGDKKAKVVYDAVGKGLLHLLVDFVNPETGQLISVDPFYNAEKFLTEVPEFDRPKRKEKENKPEAVDVRENMLKNVRHFDLYENPDVDTYRQMITDTIEMRSEGMITGHISKMFPMAKIQEAIEFIQQKQCTGKVLIDVQCMDEDGCAEDKEKKAKSKSADGESKKKSKD
ncbi:quinone oxidoreductase-like protein 2 [Anopheles ziemanni]|uniref:quinone oxidoreductase-like protein 2 n=1 Tax=Anopheles coustani TaxID=139045 RepID=UPI00265AE8F1|nr:quinone oxidoreductase-like protein 2 [Anopheles coustani]XP_058173072.1 quinone oxidoreductase-like protein 2 [Anopheles ziemanni]